MIGTGVCFMAWRAPDGMLHLARYDSLDVLRTRCGVTVETDDDGRAIRTPGSGNPCDECMEILRSK